MTSWFVYLIECEGNTIYTGIATDVAARYAVHAAGKGARYTRSRPPRRLLCTVPAADRSEASKWSTGSRSSPLSRSARSWRWSWLRRRILRGQCSQKGNSLSAPRGCYELILGWCSVEKGCSGDTLFQTWLCPGEEPLPCGHHRMQAAYRTMRDQDSARTCR
jgi:putative endonuclease